MNIDALTLSPCVVLCVHVPLVVATKGQEKGNATPIQRVTAIRVNDPVHASSLPASLTGHSLTSAVRRPLATGKSQEHPRLSAHGDQDSASPNPERPCARPRRSPDEWRPTRGSAPPETAVVHAPRSPRQGPT